MDVRLRNNAGYLLAWNVVLVGNLSARKSSAGLIVSGMLYLRFGYDKIRIMLLILIIYCRNRERSSSRYTACSTLRI